MPSRKKAKGKARRVAKEAKAKGEEAAKERKGQAVVAANQQKEETLEASLALEARMQRLQIVRTTSMSCGHGLDSPPNEKVCQDFINAFIDVFISSKDSGNVVDVFIAALRATTRDYADVYCSSSKLETVVSMLLCSGTRCILDGQYHDNARFYAPLACYFEEWMAVHVRKTKANFGWAKILELFDADYHSLIRYYRKRVPCSCLDEKYKEVKSVKKMGLCYNVNCSQPDRKAERSKMFYCTRCGEANYCSSECQKAHWKVHRDICDLALETKTAFESKHHS